MILRKLVFGLLLNATIELAAQVVIVDQCQSQTAVLIGMRVGEKIYAKDTVMRTKSTYDLEPGMYALVREGVLLGDFVLAKGEKVAISIHCDSISSIDSEVNRMFLKFIKSVDTAKSQVYRDASGLPKQILQWCYPQLLVSELPKDQLTNKGLNLVFANYLNDASGFLVNTPFFELNVDYYFDQLINQDRDTIIKYLPILEAETPSPAKEYLQRLALHRFESSKVLGHENVFIDLALRTLGTGRSLFDSLTDYNVLLKAKQLYPNRIGTRVSDFKIKDLSGASTFLRSAEGIFKVLVFFDPDCHHCRESFPAVRTFAKDFRDKGVVVYAVSTGLDASELSSFINEFGEESNLKYRWDPELSSKTFRDYFFIPSTPTIYILDQSGLSLARSISSSELAAVFNHIINN